MTDLTLETPAEMESVTPVTSQIVSMGEAARLTGKSKPTIGRMIHRGEISAQRTADGTGYEIAVSELLRFMSANKVTRASSKQGNTLGDETHVTHGKETPLPSEPLRDTPRDTVEPPAGTSAYDYRLALIEEKAARRLAEERNADLRAQLARMEELHDDMKGQRDDWQAQAEKAADAMREVQKLLPPPAPIVTPPPVTEAPPEPRRGLLFGLFRRAG